MHFSDTDFTFGMEFIPAMKKMPHAERNPILKR